MIVILVVALVVFGPSKLPELARTLGKSLREFQQAAREIGKSMNIEDPVPGESEQQNKKDQTDNGGGSIA